MKRSYIIALGVFILASLWMLSGLLKETGTGADAGKKAAAEQKPLTRVQTVRYRAQEMTRELVIHGKTTPLRAVTLKAETAGAVSDIRVSQGARVRAGEAIVQIAANDRAQRLKEAEALVRQRELEFKASRSLHAKGLRSDSEQAEAVSLLESARRQLRSIGIDIDNTTLRAPFDGVVDRRLVEQGDYLGVGDPVARVVQLDPFLVVGEVSEQEVGELETGQAAQARLITGEEVAGHIRYIAAVADEATRTFSVELEVANPGQRGLLGMTAEIHVPLASVVAHHVSPAILSLSDSGVVGVKSVDGTGVVRFHPVEILKTSHDGIWLAGLPREVELITVGQAFVRADEKVEPVLQSLTER